MTRIGLDVSPGNIGFAARQLKSSVLELMVADAVQSYQFVAAHREPSRMFGGYILHLPDKFADRADFPFTRTGSLRQRDRGSSVRLMQRGSRHWQEPVQVAKKVSPDNALRALARA